MIFEKLGDVKRAKRLSHNARNLEGELKRHENCDLKEVPILSFMELMLVENQTQEAIRLVKWRKSILHVAAMCGWRVASDVAERTLKKLCVSDEDIIQANLRAVVQNLKNSV